MRVYAAITLAVLGLSCSPAAVFADDSGACMQDAFSICGQFIPNREQVAACLLSHRSHVSPACRSALTHFNRKTAAAG
jgi:hypothetical protein